MNRYFKILVCATLLCGSLYSCKAPKAIQEDKIEYITEPITEEQIKPAKQTINNTTSNQRVKGEWTILKACGHEITAMDERAFIYFSSKEGRIYGDTGCNVINGSFSTSNTSINISNIITTNKHCSEVGEERNILRGLSQACTFVIYKYDGLYYLDLKDKNGNTTIHAKRHNADVLTGIWKVTDIKQVKVNKDVKLIIDVPELKIHGNVGCNIINGEIGLDRNKNWFIEFQNIASTAKMCDEESMHLEMNLIIALEEVELIKRINTENMILLDNDKNEVLKLQRVKLE